ncbi:ATP-binding protein [Frankia sp. AiPs1]|uniref:ATP-binding protein n=1 Tax=Frankia sp. AiPs1 TaxID=573493 RepID=UPI0035AB6EAA
MVASLSPLIACINYAAVLQPPCSRLGKLPGPVWSETSGGNVDGGADDRDHDRAREWRHAGGRASIRETAGSPAGPPAGRTDVNQSITYEADITVPSVPSAVACSRHFAASTLTQWRITDVVDVAELVISELVTNAINAGDAAESAGENMVRVRIVVAADRLFISVWDRNAGVPAVREAESDAEGGRGLFLVDSLSKRWGHRPSRRGGKIVWAELAASVPRTAKDLPIRIPSPILRDRYVFDIRAIDSVLLRRTVDRLHALA